MAIKIGINGFGRMGRLTMRAIFDQSDVDIIQINDPAADAATLAHLINFDSVHGRWNHEAIAVEEQMVIGKKSIRVSQNKQIEETDWSGCDVVIEASGKMKKKDVLQKLMTKTIKAASKRSKELSREK